VPLRGPENRYRLFQSQGPGGPPTRALRCADQGGDVAAYEIGRLGMADSPFDDLMNQSQRPGGQRPRQLGQGGLDVPGGQVPELDGSELGDGMVGGVPVVGDRVCAAARQPLGEPIFNA
jgi:hypothetical protein